MSIFKKPVVLRVVNIGLRLATLVAKLGLTLYMARYLDLAAMGIYGLVFGAVMIANVVLGIRLDYSVSRDIVGIAPTEALRKIRDQTLFYTLNYLVLALVIGGLVLLNLEGLSATILLYVLALCIVEGYASIFYTNLNSLERPLLANFLLFIRAGLWVFPVVILGILGPHHRNIDLIMAGWIGGALISILGTLWCWRHMPWAAIAKTPVDWRWIGAGVKKGFPIWLGSIGLFGGFYIDRFIVSHYLGLDYAGVATFYLSFATSLVTLIQSGVLSFVYPRLIRFHRDGDLRAFKHEVKQAHWHVALFAGGIAGGLAVAVPLLGHFTDQPKLLAELPTFWLIMIGIWIRSNAETLNYILYARHQDRPIWVGNLLYLLPGLGGNLLLVPMIGLPGIGCSLVLSNLCLFAWRWWFVRKYRLGENKSDPDQPLVP